MKSIRLLILFLGITSLVAAGCMKQPGPLGAGMSRIQVQCTGFGVTSWWIDVSDAATGQSVAQAQNLGCIFYDEINFDVAVPPKVFNTRTIDDNDGANTFDTVTFTGEGETKIVRISAFIVTIGGNI